MESSVVSVGAWLWSGVKFVLAYGGTWVAAWAAYSIHQDVKPKLAEIDDRVQVVETAVSNVASMRDDLVTLNASVAEMRGEQKVILSILVKTTEH